jgi:thiol-disulfide isomerase/thioredoxin
MLKGLCLNNISTIFLILILFFISGCNENKEKIKNASLAPKKITVDNRIELAGIKEDNSRNRFHLVDIDENDLNITISRDRLHLSNMDKPILLVNLFASWSPPCRGEVTELGKIQKRHAKDLFVLGITVNDDLNGTQMRYFMKKYGINYFVSTAKDNKRFVEHILKSLKLPDNFPIPLSIIYRDGRYYRFYEGAMPIEMIDYELKQAIRI